MRLSRILFTGDAFRTVTGEAGQISNVAWLEHILGECLRTLTGLPSEIAYPLAGGSVASFAALQGGIGLDNWARTFWQSASPALVSAIEDSCEGALVVSVEMSPVLQDALDRVGIPWIDVGVSPLRFLPDWALHLRASEHFDLDAASGYILTPSDIQAAVRHVAHWYGTAPIGEPSVVFFAQTEMDRTLIARGRFCGGEDAVAGVRPLLRGRPLLVKAHPWQSDSAVIRALVAMGGRSTTCETYALLATPGVEVVTLSSSVGQEARAFGRESRIISPSVRDWAYSGIDVMRHAVSPRLWGALLESGGVCVAPAADSDWLPNGLRVTTGSQGLNMAVWSGGQR